MSDGESAPDENRAISDADIEWIASHAVLAPHRIHASRLDFGNILGLAFSWGEGEDQHRVGVPLTRRQVRELRGICDSYLAQR